MVWTTANPALRRLVDMILNCHRERLVLVHRDRLLRFGAELVFAFCERQGIEVVVINQSGTSACE